MILGKHNLSVFLFSLLLLLSLCVTIPWWGLKILRKHPGSSSFITNPPPQSHRGVTARTTLVGLGRGGRLCVRLPHFARGECSPAAATVPLQSPPRPVTGPTSARGSPRRGDFSGLLPSFEEMISQFLKLRQFSE